jgi:hypothetical protein
LIVHYYQWFLITLYACLMHSTWPSQTLSFISPIILIIIYSYISCRFLHYPITFVHKILEIDQHCSQTQSTVFAQCHSQNVTPTAIKILCKHTHVYIYIFMVSERRKESKSLWTCSEHYSTLLSSQFLDSAIFIP